MPRLGRHLVQESNVGTVFVYVDTVPNAGILHSLVTESMCSVRKNWYTCFFINVLCLSVIP